MNSESVATVLDSEVASAITIEDHELDYYNDGNISDLVEDDQTACDIPDVTGSGSVTPIVSSNSRWTVLEPTPKRMPSRIVHIKLPITTDRDAQEMRWRLARSLYGKVQNRFIQFPWERSADNERSSIWPLMTRGQCLEDEQTEPVPVEPLVKKPRLTFAARMVRNMRWEVHDDLLRQHALVKWRVIIEENLLATSFGVDLHEQFEDPRRSSEITMSLQDVFERKATATVAKRASSFMLYLVWCRKNDIQAPTNITEEKVYKYVCHLRDIKASPTSIRSFLEALRFAEHTVGLHGVTSAISSRVKGCSSSHWKTKRPLKQAPPLSVADVYLLECIVINSSDSMSVTAAGYFLFCIYACCRFSDAMRLHSISLDIVEGTPFGFLEAQTRFHKVGNTDERRTAFLPMVALSWGLHQKSWAEVWFKSIVDSGLYTRDFVLPAPLRSGGWSDRPLTSGEASQWLRELLKSSNSNTADSYTVHGLKATGLSWCSKHGVSLEHRRLLGHHMDGKGVSALTYSRDALAGPLQSYASVVEDIRELKFRPDDTRSMRAWNTIHNQDQKANAEQSDTSSSTSSSSSSSNDMEEEPNYDEEQEQFDLLGVQRSTQVASPFLYVNVESGLGHLQSTSQPARFKCGRIISKAYKSGQHIDRTIHMCLSCSPVVPVM